MTYEYNQGFLRAYENNKELVGGPFPSEQNDWGFGDNTSFTQLRTRNGLLEWVDLTRGGQRIMFTDLRDPQRPRRYVLAEPPYSKLIEVLSPGAQDPDTGEAPGSTPPPAIPDGAVVLPAGTFIYEPTRYPKGYVLVGAGIGKTILIRKPGSSGILIAGDYKQIQDLTIDGNSTKVNSNGLSEIEMNGGQILRRIELKNFRDLGITVGGTGNTMENYILTGSAPGGSSNISYMGIHVSEDSGGFLCRGGKISYCSANGIFDDGADSLYADIDLTENHRSTFPFGGGQVDLSAKSRRADLTRVNCNGSSGKMATGFELNGIDHSLTECSATKHENYGFFGQAGGPFHLIRCKASGNKNEDFGQNPGVAMIQV